MGNKVHQMLVIWSNGAQSTMKASSEEEETNVKGVKEDTDTNPGWK